MTERKREQTLFTRNFTLLLLGQVSSLTGNFTLKFALSMYVLELTGSAAVFAGDPGGGHAAHHPALPFGGILADRANRRNVMVGLDVLSGLSVLAAVIALPLGHDIFVTGAPSQRCLSGAWRTPTVQACVPQMLSGDDLLRGNALISQTAAAVSLVAPFLGSVFYTAFGIRPVLSGAAVFPDRLFERFLRLAHQPSGLTAR